MTEVNGRGNTSTKELTVGRKLMDVLRISYTLPFVLASVTGVTLALTSTQEWLIAFIIPFDVFFLALFVNFSNDYFDHRSGVDRIRFQDDEIFDKAREVLTERFYWSGNSFDNGLVTLRQGRIIMVALAAMAVLFAIPILMYGGWMVLVLGGVGFFLAYFYTAPPLNLGARGLGELVVAISFAFMSFFSYFVIVQEFSWEAMLIAICVGLGLGSVRIVDEMTGYKAHMQKGERDLCVILGMDRVVKLISFLLVWLYLIIGILAFLDITFILLFLTLPSAFKVVRYLSNRKDELRFVRPVPEIFKVAVGTEILVIIALIAQTVLTFD